MCTTDQKNVFVDLERNASLNHKPLGSSTSGCRKREKLVKVYSTVNVATRRGKMHASNLLERPGLVCL